MSLLERINSPCDLKKLDNNQLCTLAEEIREFLIENVLKTGGHLASNLGVVELTLALYKVFDAGVDDVIWDVGHQSYVHKILTGRKDKFSTLRTLGGISGFPKVSESPLDCFDTGHSSTAMSAALGFAAAKTLKGEGGEVIAVVGDAAFSGGPSLEALNHISQSRKKVIVILNDNQMSIGANRGAFARYLNRVRTKPSYYNMKRDAETFVERIPLIGNGLYKFVRKIKSYLKYLITPGVVFEQLGYQYFGPVDGHNIDGLCAVYEAAKRSKKPCIVHVCTVKGKGYKKAEDEPSLYHGVSAEGKGKSAPLTFSKQAGKTILELAEEKENLVCVCPSMVDSCGLSDFAKKYPDRLFDTGIAEAHAVTLSAGLAQKGLVPVMFVYSSFLQRGYDGIIHDVAITGKHVVFAVDRAGVVGEDGETHQGIFDIAFLSGVPNMTVLAPSDTQELDKMLRYAVLEHNAPIAIRYPRGSAETLNGADGGVLKASTVKEGKDVTLAALGTTLKTALDAAKILEEHGISAEVINLRAAHPVDSAAVLESAENTGFLAVFEDAAFQGGTAQTLFACAAQAGLRIKTVPFSWGDGFVCAGKKSELCSLYGLTAEKAAERILKEKRL